MAQSTTDTAKRVDQLFDVRAQLRVGLLVEVPDISTWEEAIQTDTAADTMKSDGVRPETIVSLVEA